MAEETAASSNAPADALAGLRRVLGSSGLLESPADVDRYLIDHRRLYHGSTAAVARPQSTDQLVEIVRICARHQLGIVPQGGNTGYCGGATPDRSGTQIVVAMERMNKIRAVDASGFNLVAEAGCTLAQVQAAAANAARLFPLSLGSEGSCQIGGNVSTNAGGTAVLRYGVMRDLVLGLEAVLADGRIVDQLRPLRKDNTGYDVKQWFIGAEGSLGIITAVCCKLLPQPSGYATALVAVDSLELAIAALSELRTGAGDSAVAFEVMPRTAVELAIRYLERIRDPMERAHPWYILVEISIAPFIAAETQDAFVRLLSGLIERDIVRDAVFATSDSQRDDFWRMREGIPAAQTRFGRSLKHDISLPIAKIPAFVNDVVRAVLEIEPAALAVPYGHLGDGNLHFNFNLPDTLPPAKLAALTASVERLVHDELARRGGSFSAEHGIGRLKVDELERYEDPVSLNLMRRMKLTLDPQGIMNPGKVLKK